MAQGIAALPGAIVDETDQVCRKITLRPIPFLFIRCLAAYPGFVSPDRVGRIIDRTPSTSPRIHTLAGCLRVGGVPAPTRPKHLGNR